MFVDWVSKGKPLIQIFKKDLNFLLCFNADFAKTKKSNIHENTIFNYSKKIAIHQDN